MRVFIFGVPGEGCVEDGRFIEIGKRWEVGGEGKRRYALPKTVKLWCLEKIG